jgi:hypothetical protein
MTKAVRATDTRTERRLNRGLRNWVNRVLEHSACLGHCLAVLQPTNPNRQVPTVAATGHQQYLDSTSSPLQKELALASVYCYMTAVECRWSCLGCRSTSCRSTAQGSGAVGDGSR